MVEPFRMYVIYDHPTDYPFGFVVREHLITPGQSRPGMAWTATTLDEARAFVPKSAQRLPSSPDDDPKIIEVWM
jgi:hypothetical protein